MKIEFSERTDGQKIVKRTYDKEIAAYSMLQGVSCDNLPRIYSAEFDGDRFVVEEELIDGISLQYMLDCGERFDAERACEIGIEVCNALAYLHDSGFVHRDVKPEHILFSKDGRIVLIDLDASMMISTNKKKDTQLLGTTGYAAPEQFGLTRSDRRTDVFAVGIMLNEMLTGEHPSVTLCRENPMNEIIEKCIRMNPQDRYQTIEELSEALADVHSKIEEDKLKASRKLGKTDIDNRADGKPVDKKRMRAAAVLAVAVLLCVGIFIGVTGGTDSADISGTGGEPTEFVGADDEATADPIASGEYLQLYKDIYREAITTYYTPNAGTQSAPLYTEEGELVDKTFEVYADEAVGRINGWNPAFDGWILDSVGCTVGAEGYIHAEKDGKHYAIKVVIMGEEMCVYSCLPDIENVGKGYLKAQMGENEGDPWSISQVYKKDEPLTLYLAFTVGGMQENVWCDSEFVKITPYEGSVNWSSAVYELTFYNPKGGYAAFDVKSDYNTQVLCFYEEESDS